MRDERAYRAEQQSDERISDKGERRDGEVESPVFQPGERLVRLQPGAVEVEKKRDGKVGENFEDARELPLSRRYNRDHHRRNDEQYERVYFLEECGHAAESSKVATHGAGMNDPAGRGTLDAELQTRRGRAEDPRAQSRSVSESPSRADP